ncbi:MAG: heterodisulfide reductase-related iron-sulfur binding cluster [Acidobacteriota bacterium]
MTSHTTLKNALAPETEKLLGCIHCGLCLPVCPTYVQLGNENDSPRGRIYLMRAAAEGRLDPASDSFARHIDLCLGCRACETACPAGVRYGFLLEVAREEIIAHAPKGRAGFQQRMLGLALKHIFTHPGRLRAVFAVLRFVRGSSIIKLAQREGLVRSISPQAEFALSLLLSTEASGKSIATTQVKSALASQTPVDVAGEKIGPAVTVFTGCVMDGLFKHANDATSRVLVANGARLAPLETQVCCGALHAHSGDMHTSRDLAKRNIDEFEKAGQGSTIIVNAAGCGAMLKEYGELLRHEPAYAERARAFSARVRDISEYLASNGIRRGSEVKATVTYDAPCHLYHAQRVTTAPQQLLSAIPGLEYKPLEGMQDCCGGAGIYNLTEPEMSEQLLSEKIAKVKATGAELLVTANPGCHMQLGAGIRRFGADCQVVHVVEMLDESYRRAGFYDETT